MVEKSDRAQFPLRCYKMKGFQKSAKVFFVHTAQSETQWLLLQIFPVLEENFLPWNYSWKSGLKYWNELATTSRLFCFLTRKLGTTHHKIKKKTIQCEFSFNHMNIHQEYIPWIYLRNARYLPDIAVTFDVAIIKNTWSKSSNVSPPTFSLWTSISFPGRISWRCSCSIPSVAWSHFQRIYQF